MTEMERRKYRKEFPHIAPEIAAGGKPTTASDIYSFGYIFCSSMLVLDKSLGQQRELLLHLGKKLSHYHQKQRPNLTCTLKQLTECV